MAPVNKKNIKVFYPEVNNGRPFEHQGDKMARTNLERYTQAIDYIKQNIDRPLADKLSQKANAKKELLGKAISLHGGGFWHTGTKEQHKAIRALLLCQQVYLKPPECDSDKAKDGSENKG